MLEQFRADFGSLIDRVAYRLQRQLIDAIGTNYMEVSASERCTFNSPPLRPVAPLLDIDLHTLPIMLYGAQLTRYDLFKVWDVVVSGLTAPASHAWERDVLKALGDAMPDLPFSGTPLERAAQFIYAAGWSRPTGINFELTASKVLLSGRTTRNVVSMGVVDNMVLWIGSDDAQRSRRVRGERAINCKELFETPLKSRAMSSVTTGGLYRRLMAVLPHLAEQIHYVFCVAVAAGAKYEQRLSNPFDIVVDRDAVEPGADVWREARELVTAAAQNPLHELYRMLRARIGYEAFAQHLGNPHRPVGATYPERVRARQLSGLLKLEHEVRLHRTNTAAVAASLLEMQQLIGRTRV